MVAPGIQWLALATLIRSIGSGGVLTLMVLFLVSQRGYDSVKVSLVLTIGGFVSPH